MQHDVNKVQVAGGALGLAPFVVALRAVAITFLTVGVAHAATPGWDLTWNDEFDGAALDTTKWTAEFTTTPHNQERQAYLPGQVTVAGGNMVITSTNVPYQGKSYRSGRAHSNYAQRHGRWEVRADLPTSQGMWPAIWLLPDVGPYPWPSQGEIDIMENRGHQPTLTSSAFHYRNAQGNHTYVWDQQTTARFGDSVNFHSGFHTYAVEWDASKLRFFVDDVHYYTVFDAEVGGFLSRQTAPMQMTLNTAVGGQFLGDNFQPNASTVWPQQFLIDYVRVYDRNGAPLRFQNGSFEKNTGSLAGWTVFGNKDDLNNVRVHDEAFQHGGTALKIYGQSLGTTNYSGVSQGISVSPGDPVEAAASSFMRSQDALAAGTMVQMKIEFYSDFGGKHGTSALLDEVVATVAVPSSPRDVWRPHELSAVAPAGAVEARIAFVFTQSSAPGSGAIHIDNVSFQNLNEPLRADSDGDGDVDGADFLLWQQKLGTPNAQGPADADFNYDGVVDRLDLDLLKAQLGNGHVEAADQGAAARVPEPSTGVLTLTSIAGLLTWRPAAASPLTVDNSA
jgi:beta-glucanase (GH16 family)